MPAGLGQPIGLRVRAFSLSVILFALAIVGGLPPSANASQATDALASAEARLERSTTELAEAKRTLIATGARGDRLEARADAAAGKAQEATAEVDAITERLVDERRSAEGEVQAQLEADQQASDNHADTTTLLLGVGIGCLLIAIAIGLSPKAGLPELRRRLTERGLTAVAVVVLVLLFGLAVAAIFLGGNTGRVIGLAMLIGGDGAFLTLAAMPALRKSSEPSGVEQSPGRRASWLVPALASVFLFMFVALVGLGMFRPTPTDGKPSADLVQLADAAAGDPAEPPTDELVAARNRADPIVAQAEQLETAAAETQRQRILARRALRRADALARRARRSVSRASGLAQRELAAAQRQAKIAAGRAGEAATPSVPSLPSYSNCDSAPSDILVPPGSPLDGDGDGIGCES